MKIKSLSIRNIASIEKADIDFENDLRSFGDTEPATLFLITGDTGAGKTVILDCISMALYGTTPRLKGVSGKKNNLFSTADGEEIALTDIAQYTRLGITHRDECFSRLVFEGNDGVEYISTFKLGMNNRGRLRSSSWSLQIGESEIIEGGRKEEIKNRIIEAVGLSYEQFSRMAMLAQGQFAEFLTGGKDERERILEQLTDTGRFSLYGEAISRIFSRARAERDALAKTIDNESRHILSSEEEEAIRVQEKENEGKIAKLRSERDSVERILSAGSEFLSSMAHRLDCRRRRVLTGRRSGSEEFRKWEDLIRLWDATEEARPLLEQARKDEAAIGRCADRLSGFYNVRVALEEDLGRRLREYDKEKIGMTESQLKEAEGRIEKLRVERESLRPAAIAKEIHSKSGEKNLAEALMAALGRLGSLDDELSKLRLEEDAARSRYKEEEEKLAIASREKELAAAKADEARKRYDTMELSVSENYREMRARLKEEHARFCPLCGQPKDWAPEQAETEVFGKILSPLAIERDSLLKASLEAKEIEELARKRVADLAAGVADISARMKATVRAVEKEVKSVLTDSAGLSLIPPSGFSKDTIPPFRKQLEVSLVKIKEDLDSLTARAEKAEKIQKEINAFQKKAALLEKTLERARLTEVALANLTRMKDDIEEIFVGLEGKYTPDSGHPAPGLYGELGMEAVSAEWSRLSNSVSAERKALTDAEESLSGCRKKLDEFYSESGMTEEELLRISGVAISIPETRRKVNEIYAALKSSEDMLLHASERATTAFRVFLEAADVGERSQLPQLSSLATRRDELNLSIDELLKTSGTISTRLKGNEENRLRLETLGKELEKKEERFREWDSLNRHFGGTRFRTLVQSYILRPLLRNANLYLERITDRFSLTCSDENEQLSILVLDRYNKNKVRSATVLSGGERFMISLALSLALSSMNKGDMNVDILFIDEGFGTLDAGSLNAVIDTLRRLPEIAGQNGRRVGVISHREELADRIDVKIRVSKCGEGRSRIDIEA